MMKSRLLILLLFFFIEKSLLTASDPPPNFIIFIADDVSWNDLGCYGNSEVQTPNIDRLAANGIRFNNAYLTASSCSPSRNSIMTGRYPHNTGAAELHTQPPEDMISFPEVLRENGYFTAQAGKFHMGTYADRGFDVKYKGKENGDGGEEMWVNVMQERPKDKPFFMWFAALDAHRDWGPNEFSGTHDPEKITPPFYLANAEGTRGDLAKYYDEIKRFDFYIGEVLTVLEKQKAVENTMIIVMADNGRPFPHSKTRVNNRGMKTPFIIHWPEKITKEGSVSNALLSAIDIAPTLLKLAGAEEPESIQGYSFDKLILHPEKPFRNYVFAEHNWHDYEAHERMVRNKNFMYIRNARPQLPQMGPADAVGSPSHQDLVELKDKGKLTAIQTDIFVVPRPHEELYDCNQDSLHLLNIASVPEYQGELTSMREIMDEWIKVTGDNVPENLTKSWYEYKPGYIKTEYHEIRGEMPGVKTNATNINKKGPF